MNTPAVPFWCAEREERLRADWARGLTQAEIAAALGTTRSTVGGKIARLKLTRRFGPRLASALRAANGLPAAKPRGKPRARKTPSPLPRVAPSPKKPLLGLLWASAGPPGEEARRELLALGPRSCRWPLGGLLCVAHFFCATDVVAGYRYCPYHLRRSFRGGANHEDEQLWQNEPEVLPAGNDASAPAPTLPAPMPSPRPMPPRPGTIPAKG